jgi:hypothetical protein
MTCRWARARTSCSEIVSDPATAAIYLDLVRARRKDDFRWLARSQGVPPHLVEELWRGLQARLRAARPSA